MHIKDNSQLNLSIEEDARRNECWLNLLKSLKMSNVYWINI